MSRKLATTIKDSRVPGKYKRILEAYAAFANNDGTNIYPSKEKLGKKAGSSPDTVYRNTPDLIASGIMRVAESHTCRIDNCNKGGTHFTGRWGHYTTAYEIQIDNLQNAEMYLTAKQQKVNAAKCRKVGTANCGTTQALKETQGTVDENPSTDSSALTSGKSLVSKLVSETSLVSLATHFKPAKQTPDDGLWDRQQEQEQLQKQPHPYWSEALGRGLDITEVDVAADLYLDLLPNGNMNREDLVLLAELAISYGKQYLRSIWAWNHRHKDKGLRFRSIPHFAEALASGSDGSVCTQYADHDFPTCPKCKKLERCAQCGEVEDMTTEYTSDDHVTRAYLHKGCLWDWGWEPTYLEKAQAPNENMICCQIGYDSEGAEHSPKCYKYVTPKAAAAGAGFEEESA